MPSLDGATGWLNSPPLTTVGLRGHVVLVEFWTYTCINWLRTLAYVRAWSERYKDQGVVVIGAHTPEFPFEHDIENVRRAATDLRVTYPIAVDSDYAVWSAFSNHYWPALYVVDAMGQIRHHQFGEGGFMQTDMIIQALLAEAGIGGFGDEPTTVDAQGVEAPADWDELASPETYLGTEQAEGFASPGGAAVGVPRMYALPARLRRNQWGLVGDWTVEPGSAVLNAANGRIAYRFHARDVHLVMGAVAPGGTVRYRVLLDGAAPGAAHGLDVDEQGFGTASYPRLYQLLRQHRPITDRLVEIEFLDAGAEAVVFTFG